MRTLQRNKQKVYYTTLVENNEPDEWGNTPVNPLKEYGEIHELWINVSAASGQEVTQAFGNLPEYTKVLCTTDKDLPFDEETRAVTVFWVDREHDSNNGKFDHNYQLYRVAKSLNNTLIAIKRVDVQ